jgi:hypothetical protein
MAGEMAASNPSTKRLIAPETGLEPHVHVTDADFEVQADGTILITAYEERRGVLIPRVLHTVMPANLIRMAAKAARVGAEAHNMSLFRGYLEDENGGPH